MATRQVGEGVKTFTVDYDTGHVGEAAAARQAAAAIGTDHHELVLSSGDVHARAPSILSGLDQPIADPALIPLRELSDYARSEVTVAVGGEGADELFGGYPRYRWLSRTARVPHRVASLVPARATRELGRMPKLERIGRLHDAVGPGSSFDRSLVWVTSGRSSLRGELYGPRLEAAVTDSTGLEPPLWLSSNGSDTAGALMRLDQVHWLPDDVLAKADRASMGASLEMRTPYLALSLVELAGSVPPSVHLQQGGKHLLRHVLARTVPLLGTGAPKTAFRTPVADWLRGPLVSHFDIQLAESPLYTDGWFKRTTVERWLLEHTAGHADLSAALWPVFVLGCWFGSVLQP
jgi:asparagine synthase (glutamine-hydrolysing)